jgi:hypothetical protein
VLQLGPLRPQVDGLGLGVLKLGFRQGHVITGGDAAGVTVFGDVEDFFEGRGDIVQEAFLFIQGP